MTERAAGKVGTKQAKTCIIWVDVGDKIICTTLSFVLHAMHKEVGWDFQKFIVQQKSCIMVAVLWDCNRNLPNLTNFESQQLQFSAIPPFPLYYITKRNQNRFPPGKVQNVGRAQK